MAASAAGAAEIADKVHQDSQGTVAIGEFPATLPTLPPNTINAPPTALPCHPTPTQTPLHSSSPASTHPSSALSVIPHLATTSLLSEQADASLLIVSEVSVSGMQEWGMPDTETSNTTGREASACVEEQ